MNEKKEFIMPDGYKLTVGLTNWSPDADGKSTKKEVHFLVTQHGVPINDMPLASFLAGFNMACDFIREEWK